MAAAGADAGICWRRQKNPAFTRAGEGHQQATLAEPTRAGNSANDVDAVLITDRCVWSLAREIATVMTVWAQRLMLSSLSRGLSAACLSVMTQDLLKAALLAWRLP